MPHRGGHLTWVQLLGSWLGEEGTKKLLPKHKADKSVAGQPLGQGHCAQEPPICLQCLVTEPISLADGLQLNEISFCCATDSECSHLEDLELKTELPPHLREHYTQGRKRVSLNYKSTRKNTFHGGTKDPTNPVQQASNTLILIGKKRTTIQLVTKDHIIGVGTHVSKATLNVHR